MKRKCPDCGHVNDDGTVFCVQCGEPIDPQTRLVMQLEKMEQDPSQFKHSRKLRSDDDDDDAHHNAHSNAHSDAGAVSAPAYQEKQKKFPVGLILGLAAVAAVVGFLLLR